MDKPNQLDQIKALEEIRRDIHQGSYLNPLKARRHIVFLLNICDELIEGLKEIQETVKGVSS